MNQGLQTEIKAAIGAHGMWKARLYAAIQTGVAQQTVAEVKDDRRCQFGKWLGSVDAQTRSSAGYKKCSDLHAQFHSTASRVLGLALAGKKLEASKAMDPGSDYVSTSMNLVKALLAWAKDDASR